MYASTKPAQSKPLHWGPAKTDLVSVILDWSGSLLLSSYSLVYASTFCEGGQWIYDSEIMYIVEIKEKPDGPMLFLSMVDGYDENIVSR